MAARQALVSWLEEHGGYVHPCLDLFSELPNGDRGVRATKAIAEGDQLLIVPKAQCIYLNDHSGAKAQAQPDSPVLELVRSMKLSPFLSTVLLLMAGRADAAKSTYAPYIDSLPESHDCLLSWTDEERALLQGTDLEDRKESAASVFAREVEPLLRQHPSVWPPSKCGTAAFEWASGMVQSRAFHLVKENWVTMTSSEGTDLYLIPGIDMINHATQPARRSTALRLVEQPLTVQCGEPLREVILQGYFTMKADRDIAAGEEVLHTYGDLSDSQLLQTYGFVEQWAEGEGNPHDTAFIPAGLLAQSCTAIAGAMGLDAAAGSGAGSGSKKGPGGGGGGGRKRKGREGEGQEATGSAARRRVLERLGLLPPNVVVVPAEKPLSDELLTVAQVMLMPPQDYLEYAAEFKVDAAAEGPGTSSGGDGEASKGEQVVRGVLGRAYLDDPDFREAVCLALLKAVQACLKRYSTTIEEDEALLAAHAAAVAEGQQGGSSGAAAAVGAGGGRLSWRAACAVRVRLGEKRVLQRLKAALMELLAEAESEEGEEEEDGSEDLSDSDFVSEEGQEGDSSGGGSSAEESGSEGEDEEEGEPGAAARSTQASCRRRAATHGAVWRQGQRYARGDSAAATQLGGEQVLRVQMRVLCGEGGSRFSGGPRAGRKPRAVQRAGSWAGAAGGKKQRRQ